MALTFNLAAIPLKYVAFPVVVGLAAGTGALAAYVTTGSAPVAKEPVAIVAALPAASTAPAPAVVTTEQITPGKRPRSSRARSRLGPTSTTAASRARARSRPRARALRRRRRATTMRGVQAGTVRNLSPVTACCAVPVSRRKPRRRRRSRPRQRSRRPRNVLTGGKAATKLRRVYSVPSGGRTKPVIVVRPLRVEIIHRATSFSRAESARNPSR